MENNNMTMTIEEARAYLGKDYTVDYKPVRDKFIIQHVDYLNYKHALKVLDKDNNHTLRVLASCKHAIKVLDTNSLDKAIDAIRSTQHSYHQLYARRFTLERAYDLSFDVFIISNTIEVRPIMEQSSLIEDLWEEGLVNKFDVTLPDHILDPDQNPDHEDAFRYTDFYWLLLSYDEDRLDNPFKLDVVINSVTSKGFPVLEYHEMLWIGVPRKS